MASTREPATAPLSLTAMMDVLDEETLAALPRLPYGRPEYSDLFLKLHLDSSSDQASRRACVIRQQLEWVFSRLPATRRVFHPMCGPGLVAREMPACVDQYWGVDINPANVRHAEALNRDRHGFRFLQADVMSLRDAPADVDLVLFTYEAFNSFPEQELRAVLSACTQRSMPGSYLYTEVRNPVTPAVPDEPRGELRLNEDWVSAGRICSGSNRVMGSRLRVISHLVPAQERGATYYSLLWLYGASELEQLLAACGYGICVLDQSFTLDTDIASCGRNWHILARRLRA